MDGRTLERRYDEVLREAQFLRDHCRHLEQELRVCRPALYRADQRIDRLEQRLAKVMAENNILKQKLADLSGSQPSKGKATPAAFVKANTPDKHRKTPGRKPGHPAALRPSATAAIPRNFR